MNQIGRKNRTRNQMKKEKLKLDYEKMIEKFLLGASTERFDLANIAVWVFYLQVVATLMCSLDRVGAGVAAL